jgi:hypothetical protein
MTTILPNMTGVEREGEGWGSRCGDNRGQAVQQTTSAATNNNGSPDDANDIVWALGMFFLVVVDSFF